MEITNAIASFAALSQDTRLKAFKLLVSHEPEGLPAGEIARQLSVPHSRQIIYRASLSHMDNVIQFLLQDCCAGHPKLCASLMDSLSDCRVNESAEQGND